MINQNKVTRGVQVVLAFTLTLLASMATLVSFGSTPQALSFEERVAAQEAIERVYYEHRSWPKENPTPKPPFEQAVPRAGIEARVAEFLQKADALDPSRHRPIEASQLQAEMDRMVRDTKDPETLGELFTALGNAPDLIAECLAKPLLVDRLTQETHGAGELGFGEPGMRAGGAWGAWSEGSQAGVPFGTSADQSPGYTAPEATLACAGSWTATSTGANVPAARFQHTAVWTGAEMIVWGGGAAYGGPYYNTGGRYTPATDSWVATSVTNAPVGRWGHTAVWTGTEMIVWGGGAAPTYHNTGGRYNPGTNIWTGTSITPQARTNHTAIWTGTEMIIWGGTNVGNLNDGSRYNPAGNSWTPTSTGTNVPSVRYLHSAVWTGSKMVVWGGYDDVSRLNTGGRYDPVGNAWTPTSMGANVPAGRVSPSCVWSGSEMIIWGGAVAGVYQNGGGRYNPSSDTWTLTSAGTGVPSARAYHPVVWTGSEMVVWGGMGASDFNTGGRYNPPADSWTATSTGANVPVGRRLLTAVWTGQSMVVWGGQEGYTGTVHATGGVYSFSLSPAIAGASSNTCPAQTVTLSVSGSYSTYQWQLNTVPITGATAATYPAAQSGNYTVSVTDSSGCSGTSAIKAVTVTYCATTEVSPVATAHPARLTKDGASPTGFYLYFEKIPSATGYNIYEGNLGTWYSHGGAPGNACAAAVTDLGNGEVRAAVTPTVAGDHYFLITAFGGAAEGPSGFDGLGVEIPPAQSTCAP